MTDREWEKFFELLEKAVNLDTGGSWQDKRDEILRRASDSDKGNLSELANWFVEE